MSYNPTPPRVWSRVQNQCTYINPNDEYLSAYIPLTGQTVSQAQANYEKLMINKGNVLQYKGNSARLTKTQKYSQLARMCGPNRTKVFATQSQTYSNPNTTGLLRQNFNTYPFPNEIVGVPNNISGPFAYDIPNPNDCSSNTIIDGGTLVCGTFANPCSGEIIKRGNTSSTICSPASASNVPGPSVLCWNNKVQTWFPRQRYVMNNSGDKWPVNYKGFVSAVKPDIPTAPVLYLNYYTQNIENNIVNNVENAKSKNIDSTKYDIHFYWKSNYIFKVDSFNIYINDNLHKTIKNDNKYTHVINNYEKNNCIISITSILNNIESNMSNYIFFKHDTMSQLQPQPIDPINCCCDLSNCCCDLSNCCCDLNNYSCDLTDVNIILTIIDEKFNNINSNINNKMDNVNSKIEELKLDMNTNFSDLELSIFGDQNINNKMDNVNSKMEELKLDMSFFSEDQELLTYNESVLADDMLLGYIGIRDGSVNGVTSKTKSVVTKRKSLIDYLNTNFSDLELSYNLLDQNINNKMDNVNSKMDNVNSKIEEFNLDMNTNFSDLKLSCNLLDQNINIKTENINNTLDIITNSITNVFNVTSSILEKVSLFKNCDCSCSCSNDSNCNCVFYNALFSSSIITKINNYVSTYIETIYQDTDTYIPIDIFHNLSIELTSLENLFASDPSCCFFNIIDIYRNMLKIVKTAYDNKNLAKSTLKSSESWKNDSEILNDRDKLNEYIQNLSKNFFVTSVNITSAYANLKTQYQIYIQLYGLPENLEFDIDKLSSILKEIGDY